MTRAFPHVLDYVESSNRIIVWTDEKVHGQLRFAPGAQIGRDIKTSWPFVILPGTRESILIAEALSSASEATKSYIESRSKILNPISNPVLEHELLKFPRTLLKHQVEFINHAYPRFCSYNGSEQGTGKTTPALILPHLWDSQKVLIVGPKSLASQWLEEARVTLGPYCPKLLNLSECSTKQKCFPNDQFPIYIYINYESVSSVKQAILNWVPDVLICDEAWKLKSPTAKVTKSILEIAKIVQRIILLSGTPIGNDVGDWFSQLQIEQVPMPWNSRDEFLNRFAILTNVRIQGGRTISKPIGCQDPVGLMSLLSEAGWYRASKATCLNLPPKHFRRVRLELTENQQKWYDRIEECGEAAINPLSLAGQRVAMIRKQQITSGFIPYPNDEQAEDAEQEPNKFIGSAKLDWILQYCEDVLMGNPSSRCIIWCKFNFEVQLIYLHLFNMFRERVKTVTGKTKQSDLDSIKESFNSRTEDGVQIIIVQIKKMAYGHNLHFGDVNIYSSHSWSWIEYGQSQDRTHRNGREEAVEYILLEACNTVDQTILRALENKEDLSTSLAIDTVGG